VYATAVRVAVVVRADVAVVTYQGNSAHALSLQALVGQGALVPVVARGLVERNHTAHGRIAAVVGAYIAVIALYQAVVHTHAGLALIAGRTRISVVAVGLVVRMHATGAGVARIIGAYIAVIAVCSRAGSALSTLALVVQGALVAVVAGAGGRLVNTTTGNGTRVNRARVFVVAVDHPAGEALPLGALVAVRARIPVVAVGLVVRMHATGDAAARIIGAYIAVVAVKGGAAGALPFGAQVLGGAYIAVIARCTVVREYASALRQA